MDVKKEFLNRDRLIKVLSKDGLIRAAIAKTSKSAQMAQDKHQMPSVPAIYTARTLTAATLLASFLKGEERVIVNASGNGILQTVYAEAMPVGEVRAFARYAQNIDEAHISDVKDLFGKGIFKVIKIQYDRAEPQIGIIDLQKGDITSEIDEYLNHSEQTPSAVVLDVSMDGGLIAQSGGILVQALPGANYDSVLRTFDAINEAPPICQLFERDYRLDDILKILLPFDYDMIGSNPLDFFCRCSKDNFKSKLTTLQLKELKDMKKQNHNELVCQYCGSKYYLDEKDFDEIIQTATAKHN